MEKTYMQSLSKQFNRYKTILAATMLLGSLNVAIAAPTPLDHIVAVVNGDVITANELDKRIDTISSQFKQKGTTIPKASLLRKQVLDHMINEELQLQLAKINGIDVDAVTVDEALLNLAKGNNLTLSAFRESLQHEGYGYEDFRNDLKKELLIQRVEQRQLSGRIVITQREIAQRVEQLKKLNDEQVQYHVGHILVALPENPTPAQISTKKKEADDLMKQLNQGASFEQLAISHSNDQQALEGGDLGWRHAGELPSLIAEQIANMKIGAVVGPLHNASGFHIVKLLDKKAETPVANIEQTHVRHILLQADPVTENDTLKKRISALRDKITAGADFAKLAKQYSEDPNSARNGGDLGWISPGQTEPAFEQMMNEMKVNQVSKVFQTSYGWHFLQVLGRREQNSSEDYLKELANRQIYQRKFQDALQNWIVQLRDEAHIEIREKA